MIRVHVICEGQTEEMFVNEVMQPIFTPHAIYLQPALVGKPGHKGGYLKYARLSTDVKIRLLNDKAAYCTTIYDFYGLPEDFPGKMEAYKKATVMEKQQCITDNLVKKLTEELGSDAMRRFIPYVQLYEFEGLLFSQPCTIASEIGATNLNTLFESIRNDFDTPEHVNNSQQTAPSKRIKAAFSQYDKVIHGSLIALEIGIHNIREECPLFNRWIDRLQNLKVLV